MRSTMWSWLLLLLLGVSCVLEPSLGDAGSPAAVGSGATTRAADREATAASSSGAAAATSPPAAAPGRRVELLPGGPVVVVAPGDPALEAPGHDGRAVAVADVDGDGRPDVLVCRFFAPPALFHARGADTAGAPRFDELAASPEPARSFDATFGDVDGDGDPDLYVATANDEPNLLLRNESSPGAPRLVPAGGGPATEVLRDSHATAGGDLDLDGDLDLLVANRHQPDDLFLNDGRGGFCRAERPFGEGAGASRDLSLGDLDGDGDLDVVVAASNDQPNAVWLNQGGRQGGVPGELLLLRADPTALPGGRTMGCSLGDLDGDGDLDLAFAARDGDPNRLFLNRGDGSFVPHPDDLAADGGHSQECAFADVDQDGRLDFFVVNRGEPCFLYWNAGGGRLQRAADLLPEPLAATSAAWLRLGTDARLDLLVTTAEGGSRHVRIGRP